MKGTRFRPVLRECLGSVWRELKIAFTPVPKDKKWVFLVGCYNSGTTLLAEVLGKHPEISALPTEGHFITDQFVKDYDIGLPRMWVDREDLFYLTEDDEGPDPYRLKKEWAMRLDARKPVLLEKSPPNASKTRWLQKHFENCYFVGIVRDPYAVSEGITRKADPKHLINSWPIEKSAYQWARSNEVLVNDSEHLERFMWVRYEDLAENTVPTLNSICEFVGIKPYDEHLTNSTWSIHERDEKIRNMNDESIKRLTQEQKEKVYSVAEDMMKKFGYQKL